jgi:arginyl-tRNA synthetase
MIHEALADALSKVIKNKFEKAYTPKDLRSQIVIPPQTNLGDLAFGAFMLSKELKLPPVQIAKTLADELKSLLTNWCQDVQAAGPFVNFTLNPGHIAAVLPEVITLKKVEAPERIMIEYSQPNTHKELHVGHMRNMALGLALVELNRGIGHEVVGVTYPGDVGTHVAKCLWYLKNRYTGTHPSENDDKGNWLGAMYSQAHLLLESERGTPSEETNRQQLTQILQELKAKSGAYYELWKETREWSLDTMKKAYRWANITFDRWYFESEVDVESVAFVKKLFSEGKLQESEGAIGMDLSDYKLGFLLLLKSDGNGLYATKDLMLAYKKVAEFHISKNYYIVDKRQSHHFKQVFKALDLLGFEQAKKCEHIEYGYVKLPEGLMKSRDGNIIPLSALIQNMEETITSQYLEKYRGEWSDSDIQKTATMIANGAIKYGMIKVDNTRDITFEMDEWLKLDGDTGPYLQYVHARTASLLTKLSEFSKAPAPEAYTKLTTDAERALVTKLMHFSSAVHTAASQFRTPVLCVYLYELSRSFNHFYVECPIARCPDEDLKRARYQLVKHTNDVIKQGLHLLGIPAPERM